MDRKLFLLNIGISQCLQKTHIQTHLSRQYILNNLKFFHMAFVIQHTKRIKSSNVILWYYVMLHKFFTCIRVPNDLYILLSSYPLRCKTLVEIFSNPKKSMLIISIYIYNQYSVKDPHLFIIRLFI